MLVAAQRQRPHSPTSNCKSSIKLITTTTADPATPLKNMISNSRMKIMATSIGIDCNAFRGRSMQKVVKEGW